MFIDVITVRVHDTDHARLPTSFQVLSRIGLHRDDVSRLLALPARDVS